MRTLKILFFSNNEKEDIEITNSLKSDGHIVDVKWMDYDENLDDKYDVIIKRNVWTENEKEMPKYFIYKEQLNKRLIDKNVLKINFNGKFDENDKSYLVDLYKKGYQVVPTINKIEDIDILPKTEKYLLKPKNSYDGIGQIKLNKERLKDTFTDKYIIQPFIIFQSEVQFYFIENKFEYCLEFIPSKIPVYPKPKLYKYTEKELNLARQFANLNDKFIGIQRIDFLKLKNGELKLIEIEDDSPYLDLDCVSGSIKNKFIEDYKDMIYKNTEI